MNLQDKGNILKLTGALHSVMEQVIECQVKDQVLDIEKKIEAIVIKDLEQAKTSRGIKAKKEN